MDTYHAILLVINWIASGIGVIAGFILMGNIGGFGILIVIIAIIIGIIGHFLTNVGLAIPFILLNNGDILESIKKNQVIQGNTSDKIVSQSNTNSGSSYSPPKSSTSNVESYVPSFLRKDDEPATFVERPKVTIFKKCTKCKKELEEDIEKCPNCKNKTFE